MGLVIAALNMVDQFVAAHPRGNVGRLHGEALERLPQRHRICSTLLRRGFGVEIAIAAEVDPELSEDRRRARHGCGNITDAAPAQRNGLCGIGHGRNSVSARAAEDAAHTR